MAAIVVSFGFAVPLAISVIIEGERPHVSAISDCVICLSESKRMT